MSAHELQRKLGWFLFNRIHRRFEQHLPEEMLPSSIEQGYEIQASVARSLGPVSAWKLGGVNASSRKAFNTDKLYFGPIFADALFFVPEGVPAALLAGIGGEAEVAFRLSPLLISEELIYEDPWDLVDMVGPAVELPASIVADLPRYGLPALLADCCASGALVVGHQLPVDKSLRAALNNLPIKIHTPDLTVEASSSHIIGTPIGVLEDFVRLAYSLGVKLTPGQWVSTGGCSACIPLPLDQDVFVDFGCLGRFTFEVVSG